MNGTRTCPAASRRGSAEESTERWPLLTVAKPAARRRTMPRQEPSPATPSATLVLELRRRRLATDEHGRRDWVDEAPMERVPASAAAVLVCDMWDRHWSTGASLRVEQLAPRIDAFCRRMRAAGALVVHAPSDTMAAYEHERGACSHCRVRPLPCPPGSIELPPLPVACDRWRF